MVDFTTLPDDLPVPVDDGAADHLPGTALPAITLPSTTGDRVDFKKLGSGRTVIYLYPMTGRPGVEQPRAPGMSSQPAGSSTPGRPVIGYR